MNSFVSQAEQFGNKKIDIIICNNEPWFKGKNIASILGYTEPTRAIKDNVDVDDKLSLTNLCKKLGPGGPHPKYNQNELKTIYINKNGLIQLLSLSKMPNKSDFCMLKVFQQIIMHMYHK